MRAEPLTAGRPKRYSCLFSDFAVQLAPAGFAVFVKALEEGMRERAVAATQANATSSRSHTIVQLDLVRTETNEATGQARCWAGCD